MADYATRRTLMVDTQVRPSDVTKFPIIDAMLSIPRDSVTSIPHLGRAKINAAYSHGYANAAALYGQASTKTSPSGTKNLWLRLDMPTALNTGTSGAQTATLYVNGQGS